MRNGSAGRPVEILDCTIRDGGYVNGWQFQPKVVREVYRSLSKSGVDFVELGFRGTERHFDARKYGLWRFSTEEVLGDAVRGIQGARVAIMGDYGKIDLEDFVPASESVADMVRIAANKRDVPMAVALLGRIKDKGYLTSLQAMAVTNYSPGELGDLRKLLESSGLDYFYIADSYGSVFPGDMARLVEPFLGLPGTKLGFHPHNNLQMALANSLEAVRVGVDIIDSSIFGMGRGAGNLPTEILLANLQLEGDKRYNVVPVLNCIERYFVDMMRETPWGYNLPYMISGILKCHPYYSSELVKRREYAIEDIWRALEIVNEMRPTGFDSKLLEGIINKGVLAGAARAGKTTTDAGDLPLPDVLQPVPYIDRHRGRDFLVLANGPSLAANREAIQRFIDKHRPVVLGANFLAGMFTPDYHAFNNKNRLTMHIDSVHPSSRLLIGENIPDDITGDYVSRPFEPLCFLDRLNNSFAIAEGRITTNCRTISVLLLGVAIVMGAKRIFGAGFDGYVDKRRFGQTMFYAEGMEPSDEEVNLERHRWNEYYLQQIDEYVKRGGGEGIHIITPTSHETYYKGIDNYL